MLYSQDRDHNPIDPNKQFNLNNLPSNRSPRVDSRRVHGETLWSPSTDHQHGWRVKSKDHRIVPGVFLSSRLRTLQAGDKTRRFYALPNFDVRLTVHRWWPGGRKFTTIGSFSGVNPFLRTLSDVRPTLETPASNFINCSKVCRDP